MDGLSLFVNAIVAGNTSEVSLSGRRKSFGFSIEISFHNDIADSAFIRFWSITKLLDYDIKKEVCRNARCTFFLIHYHTTRFIFFKL